MKIKIFLGRGLNHIVDFALFELQNNEKFVINLKKNENQVIKILGLCFWVSSNIEIISYVNEDLFRFKLTEKFLKIILSKFSMQKFLYNNFLDDCDNITMPDSLKEKILSFLPLFSEEEISNMKCKF